MLISCNKVSRNENIVIKPADKGGKVVIMDRNEYHAECVKNLSDKSFYNKLDDDPNDSYASEVKAKAKSLLDEEIITGEEFRFITKDTEERLSFMDFQKFTNSSKSFRRWGQ